MASISSEPFAEAPPKPRSEVLRRILRSRWTFRGKSLRHPSDRAVRTLSRCAHQQGDRNRYRDGNQKTCLGGKSVLRGCSWLEPRRVDTSIYEAIVPAPSS